MPIDFKPAVWRSGFKELHRVWAEYIEGVMGSTTKGYSHSRYSSICLPILVYGYWVLLVCDMENQCYRRVLFNNVKYEVDEEILDLGKNMKFIALESGLLSVDPKPIEKNADWASKEGHPRPALYFNANNSKRI